MTIIANCYENVKVNIVLYRILFFHVCAGSFLIEKSAGEKAVCRTVL